MEVGDLSLLTSLNLEQNEFVGEIPSELGQLEMLKTLRLGQNKLTGMIPAELGNLTVLDHLSPHKNQLMGTVPLTLTGLKELTTFWFFGGSGQIVCAPQDESFQQWLAGITDAMGPNCTAVTIEEVSDSSIPETGFNLLGNYPNPFRSTTSIGIELFQPARSRVELLDVTGRRVMTTSAHILNLGRQLIPIYAEGLQSGVYLYRVLLDTQDESHILAGRMLLIR